MSDLDASVIDSSTSVSGSPKSFTAAEEAELRESLRRCSEKAIEASVAYRRCGDAAHIPTIIVGIIERFVEPDLRPRLAAGECDDLRVIEDLGIDSLTMMEIVMLVEEVVQMTIGNDELKDLRTIGDIRIFVDCRARGVPPPAPAANFSAEQIQGIMPIQPPFLFLNEARVSATQATAGYRITGQEFFLQGHFKNNPVMPASIMLEALGQLGVLYLLTGLAVEAGHHVASDAIYFTSTDGVRCSRMCKPGDVLSLTIKPKRVKAPFATFEGVIRVGQERAVLAEEITLTFKLVETPMPTPPAPIAHEEVAVAS